MNRCRRTFPLSAASIQKTHETWDARIGLEAANWLARSDVNLGRAILIGATAIACGPIGVLVDALIPLGYLGGLLGLIAIWNGIAMVRAVARAQKAAGEHLGLRSPQGRVINPPVRHGVESHDQWVRMHRNSDSVL